MAFEATKSKVTTLRKNTTNGYPTPTQSSLLQDLSK